MAVTTGRLTRTDDHEGTAPNLPPFDRGKACVKCGSIGARVEYRQWSRHDCLKRTCSECGFSWDEATLDAPHATSQGDRNSDQSPEAQGDGE